MLNNLFSSFWAFGFLRPDFGRDFYKGLVPHFDVINFPQLCRTRTNIMDCLKRIFNCHFNFALTANVRLSLLIQIHRTLNHVVFCFDRESQTLLLLIFFASRISIKMRLTFGFHFVFAFTEKIIRFIHPFWKSQFNEDEKNFQLWF